MMPPIIVIKVKPTKSHILNNCSNTIANYVMCVWVLLKFAMSRKSCDILLESQHYNLTQLFNRLIAHGFACLALPLRNGLKLF